MVVIGEDVWRLALKLAKEKNKIYGNQLSDYLSQLHKQKDLLQNKMIRLIDMRTDNELTKEEFALQKGGILQEQARVKSLIKDNEDTSKNWLEPVEDFINTAFYARDWFNNGDLEDRRELVYKLGENLLLKDQKLFFSFKKPYDVLLKPEYRTDGQVCPDSDGE